MMQEGRVRRRIGSIFLGLGLAGMAALAGASPQDPAQLRARETHEGMTIAVDPYVDAVRAKEKFGKKHPYDADILAIEVWFKNDTDRAILVGLDQIQLVIAPPEGRRQKVDWIDLGTVIEKVLHEKKGGPEVKKPRVPIPLPRSSASKDWKKLEEAWSTLVLSADVVAPKSTVHGFLFFDMGRHMDWAPYSRLLVSRLKVIESGKEMFYFEVDLGKGLPRP